MRIQREERAGLRLTRRRGKRKRKSKKETN